MHNLMIYGSETLFYGKRAVYRRHMMLGDVASCNWVDICTVVSEEPAAFVLQ